ncbi:MAG: type III secretion system export apparatus subunit SctS [Alphaproteobacteria bacterium]|nr:type III secretion system export apparatus subunit SctS [Alphaproteobacteria bacterium]MDA7983026.1 type III secretion system export apparatus subunit SctS [Alphaproteobacteria bacterium]MDA7984169.1 type III secretion system export apparatus subunit SctS [Alphaproteobacteria bacterium]MDA7987049.1 type III secretion system export apparatus subunit SctS [Alphaproteobacteria bacterium]MDA7988656.1 type III secretion system export apparatus subunit SctS [Alphaproteobacteria bacterium]
MEIAEVSSLAVQTISFVLQLSLPVVIAAAVTGVLVSLLQALTQVQDQTLPFAFKLVAVTAALFFTLQSVGAELLLFTELVFARVESVSR